MHYIIGYFASLTVFLALDAVWIMVIARAFYRRELRPLLRDNFLFTPALLFYLVYIAILFYLAVLPHTGDAASLKHVMLSSALLGLAAYGTYNMTNYAVLNHWSLRVTYVDSMWGVIVTSCAGIAGYYAVTLSFNS